MTREEAIRILDPQTAVDTLAEIEYYHGFRGIEAVSKALDEACILAVAALREHERLRWIPVTERLPDQGDRVLCVVKSFAFPGRKYYNILRYDKYGFNENGIYTDDVTHWMPLPEPPKEGLE